MEVTNPGRFRLVVGVFLLAALVVVGGGWHYATANLEIKKSGEFSVEEGMGATAVWGKLVQDGFTDRSLPWRYRAWRQDAAGQIKVGQYQLEEGERAAEVIERFVEGDIVPNEFTITYPEGFTLEQMAERTAARGIGTREEFMTAAMPAHFADQYPFIADIPSGRNLEGYLFPDTYQVFADDTPHDVIARMLATFNRKVIEANVLTTERSIDELVIMASIIEREVLSDDDMALVSGVLWKRADEGGGLDADATVRYALKKWDAPLTVQDLASDSPYNTRRWRGLPPGPISNPGLRALAAAGKPEESEFYYYLSTSNGETIFSKTNDEHNLNKAKYLQ